MCNEDKVINELDFFINLYKSGVKKYESKHKLTRTSSVASFSIIFVMVSILAISKLLSIEISNLMTYAADDFMWINFSLIFILPILTICFIENKFNISFLLLVVYQLISFYLLFSMEMTLILMSLNSVVFIVGYFSNRQFGYTRGWSRNRTMVFHLERMKREYKLAIESMNLENIGYEQDNVLSKLYLLEEENVNAMHKDIVGDYFTVQDTSLNWLKTFKK